MARTSDLHGLDKVTRQKVANRPFEDVRRAKEESPLQVQTEVSDKMADKNGVVKTSQVRRLSEEPPTKARLTVREKKRKMVRTSISLADE